MSIEEERATARFLREQSESKPKTYSSFGNFVDRQNDIYTQRDRAQKAVYDAYETNRQELVKAFQVSDTNPRAISRQQYDQLSEAARKTRDAKISAIRSATSKALRQNNQIRDQERGLDRANKVPPPEFISIGDFGSGLEYTPVALPESYYQSEDYVRPPDPEGNPLSQAIAQAARGNITQEQLNQAIQENAKATEALVPKVEMPETFVDVQRRQAKEIFDSLGVTPEMIEGGPENYNKALENYAFAIGLMGTEGVTKRLQEQIVPAPTNLPAQGSITDDQARNLAELITTYTNVHPMTSDGQYSLDGLTNLIKRDGFQASVDWALSQEGAIFRGIDSIKTPYPVAKELVDRLYKDANFSNTSYYGNWLDTAQTLTPQELVEKWNNAQPQDTTKSKLTPEEIEGFTTKAAEEKPALVQNDLNNFIQSANKIYQGYDLTPNYGPEADAKQVINNRLLQAGYKANETDVNRWNQTAERYGIGVAIAQLDRDLGIRQLDKAIPTFAQGEGFEGVKLTGQLPSTYAGSSLYKDVNYAGQTIGQAPSNVSQFTTTNPLVGTGSMSSSGIPIQGVPTPTLPQIYAPTNIPIQGVPTPQPLSTSSFIQSNLGTSVPAPVTAGGVVAPPFQEQPQRPSIFSNLPVPQPLVGTFGGQPLFNTFGSQPFLQPQPQVQPQVQPQQPLPTTEEFIRQQQQPPVKMANGGSVSSSGVRRLKMSGYQEGGEVSPAMMTPEQLEEFNRNLQREIEEEKRKYEQSGEAEFYSAIRPAMEDINERVKQTLEMYRMGRATEADVQKLLPSLSEYEIASQFGRTDTGGYRSRDVDAPSRDRLRDFIETQKPTIDANRPDMFPYDPRGPKMQDNVLRAAKGGEVTDGDFIQEMMTGTRPEDLPVNRQKGSPPKGEVANDDSWKDDIINQMNEKYSGRGPFDERMEEEMLRQRMGKEIKGLKPPPESKVMFPDYRVVEDLEEFDNARVFHSKPETVFADPKLLRSNPLVLSHEFDHQMEGKARKRYSHAGDPSELKTPKEDLVLPGKPEHYLEPAGKLKVSEITKLQGGGPEYFMEQNLMGRGMSYKEARDYLKSFKEQLGSERVRDYITKKYPDLEFFRLGAKGEELSEYLADLSGIETFKGIDLTKDSFIKRNVFGGDDDLIAEYKAVTGLRQDRLDAKDLAPYIPDYDQSLSAKAKRFIQEKLR